MKNETSSIEQLVFEMQYRNYSSSSIKTYRELLLSVEKHFLKSIKEVTVDELKQYLHRRITQENVSVSLVNQTISAFKILQTDVLKREWNAFKIKRPRREKKLPEILSQEEIQKMISCTKNIKHKAFIMLAYSSGMRRQEIQQIKPSAIDSSRMQIHVVQGKGKKDRFTILSTKALDYKNSGIRRVLKLEANEFIRRFLQHVLPSGFYKIRYYGFLSLRNMSETLKLVCQLISKTSYFSTLEGLCASDVWRELTGKDPFRCPKCNDGLMLGRKKIMPTSMEFG